MRPAPFDLKIVERKILKELEKANFQVYFRIKGVTPQGFPDYDLASKDSGKEVPPEARKLIEKRLEEYRRKDAAQF